MTQWIPQSTQSLITLGPFVGDTDGVTAVTTAQTSAADIAEIMVQGTTAVIAITTDNTFTAITNGGAFYKLLLTSDNASTLGMLEVIMTDADQFLPIIARFMVVPKNVWDSYFGSDALQVHITEMDTDVIGPTIIASDTITSDTFATDAITAEKIKTAAITAAAIATDAIGATQIASDAIGAEAIAADAIGASQLATDAIGATQLASDAIIDEALSTSAIDKIVAALNDLSAADINAEVLDVLNVDTFGESTGVPSATTTLRDKIGFLYMSLRNRVDISTGDKSFYTDTGAVQWKKPLTDTGVYTEAEATSP